MEGIELDYVPQMENGLLVACFEGWGNALDISMGMAHFLIKKLGAEYIGKLPTDPYYIMKERRPLIEVVDGSLQKLDPPTCEFYWAPEERVGRDILIVKGDEPDIQWFRFADSILSLSREAGVKTVASCGGMLDNTHYSDTVISVVASHPRIVESLPMEKPSLIDYAGQSSIHSTLHFEAKKRDFDCIGFYCHCPAYLQGITHFGLLAHLGKYLAEWAGFELDTTELSTAWLDVKKQIQAAIEQNPDLKNFVSEIKKSRGKSKLSPHKKDDNVINLEDYLDL